MDILTRDDIKKLINNDEEICVSIYLPTEISGNETEQGKIRLKNSISEAENQLKAYNLRRTEIKRILKPVKEFLDDNTFWNYQSHGLAIFLSQNTFKFYKLPLNFKQLTVVSKRFHIKPIMKLLSGDGHYYILAISQNNVRLFNCTLHTVEEVELKGVPKSMQEALWYDDPEKQIQYHTGNPNRGKGTSIYHGHGVGIDNNKNDILRFFHKVDYGLDNLIKDRSVPLIVAAVDYLIPIYMEASTYTNILDTGIKGSPDHLSEDTLHQRSIDIAKSYFDKNQRDNIEKYNDLIETDSTSNDIETIIPAAYNGRIETLFVSSGIQQWGSFDWQTNKVNLDQKQGAQAVDLLDFAAIHTLLTDGDVYVIEPEHIPDNKPYAAILRY